MALEQFMRTAHEDKKVENLVLTGDLQSLRGGEGRREMALRSKGSSSPSMILGKGGGL